MKRHAPILAAAVALAATSAAASNVTTNTYSESSYAEDIASSCKEIAVALGLNSLGLSGRCNLLYDGQHSLSITKRNIASEVYCKPDADGVLGFAWGAGTDKGGYIRNPAVVVDSTGDDYLLEADCQAWGSNTSADDVTLDLGDTTSGYKNSTGALVKR